ncbi:MAG: hypothetical protein NVS2B17_19770 [Candidatus Velthaea sp.]
MIDRSAIRGAVSNAATAAFGNVPLRAWEAIFPKDIIALCYHMVSDEDLAHMRLYDYKTSQQFETDVRFAKARAVSYQDLLHNRIANKSVAANSFLFTFDDGFVECFSVIRPILLRHAVDAAFFVVTDYLDDRDNFFECTLSLLLETLEKASPSRIQEFLDAHVTLNLADTVRQSRAELAAKRLKSARFSGQADALRARAAAIVLGLDFGDRAEIESSCRILQVDPRAYAATKQIFMSRDHVRQLARDGFTIGSHARQHRLLEYKSIGEIEEEIVASCEEVQRITGQARVPFAFPYRGIHVDRAGIADIMRRNPIVELVFDSGYLRRDPSYIVNRVFNDEPSHSPGSNVPGVLQEAWSRPSAWFRP